MAWKMRYLLLLLVVQSWLLKHFGMQYAGLDLDISAPIFDLQQNASIQNSFT
jgi:hypothetical protein